jgi:hypothetical protein
MPGDVPPNWSSSPLLSLDGGSPAWNSGAVSARTSSGHAQRAASIHLRQAPLSALRVALVPQLVEIFAATSASIADCDDAIADDLARVRTATARTAPVPPTSSARDVAAIVDALAQRPVEDGVTHPAEHMLAKLAARDRIAVEWAILSRVTAVPDLLRVAGRLTVFGGPFRASAVRTALGAAGPEARDAALYAAETWGDAELSSIVEAHLGREPLAWLRDYAQSVLDALRG